MRTQLSDTLTVLGERWALLIVREVSIGLHRFDDIQAATGAPRAVVADRLRKLVASGIMLPRPYRVPGARARTEYALTTAGVDLLPLLAGLSAWGEKHLPGTGEPDVDYRHVGCGGRLRTLLGCECGTVLHTPGGAVAQINRPAQSA